MRFLAIITLCASAAPVWADTLIAARTLRSNAVITAQDIAVRDGNTPGTLSDARLAIGQETRVVIYEGHPLRPGDIGPPALIERNEIIVLVFEATGLLIRTEGRALGRAAQGDRLRVMNLSSRSTVTGTVSADGSVRVQ